MQHLHWSASNHLIHLPPSIPTAQEGTPAEGEMGFRSAGYHPGSADPKHSAHTLTNHLSAHTQNWGQAQGLADWVSVDFAKTPETGRCVGSVCVFVSVCVLCTLLQPIIKQMTAALRRETQKHTGLMFKLSKLLLSTVAAQSFQRISAGTVRMWQTKAHHMDKSLKVKNIKH